MDNSNDLSARFQGLGLTNAGLKLIEQITKSEPVRRVSSNGFNTPSRYPSRKMGCTIQAESQLELSAVLDFEFRESCVGYYDQPCRLSIPVDGGKVGVVSHVPDFLVIEEDQVFFEELKPAERLEKLTKIKPWRYQYDERSGCFISLAVEKVLEGYGISYRIRTDRSFPRVYVANIRYLLGYMKAADRYWVSDSLKRKIDEAFSEQAYITFSELLNRVLELTIEDALYLLATGYLYCDLKEDSLQKRDTCRIAKSRCIPQKLEVVVRDHQSPVLYTDDGISTGDKITFGGDQSFYRVVSRSFEQCVLVDDEGNAVTFQLRDLERMRKEGLLTHAPKPDSSLKATFMSLSEKELETAFSRFRMVKKLLNGASYVEIITEFGVSERTARRYKKKYLQSQQACGDGFIGLLDSIKKRGNRSRRIPEQDLMVIHQFIEDEYLDYKGMKISQAYHLFLVKHDSIQVSYQTFRRCILELQSHQIVKKREGDKKGIAAQPLTGNLHYGSPVHGSRAFEVAHIDHTQIDLEVCAGVTNTSIRPWLTIMIDACTRMVLAFSISLIHPSRISCMHIMRECVLRHDRLPEVLVVDGGKEFESIYFEQLCARYDVEIRSRRCNPRKGAVVERMFGVVNSRLFHQMIGNTQQTKDPRGLTKRNNPKNLAIWQLEELEKVCAEFFYSIYANKIHITTNEAPLEAVKRSLIADGHREYRRITDHDTFFYESMIPALQNTRTVQPTRGIKVQGHYFWCPEFGKQKHAGKSVPVKIDIFNPDRIACYIGGEWVFCQRGTIRSDGEVSKYTFDVEVSLTPSVTGLAQSERQAAVATAELIKSTEDKLSTEKQDRNAAQLERDASKSNITKRTKDSFGSLTNSSLDEFGEL